MKFLFRVYLANVAPEKLVHQETVVGVRRRDLRRPELEQKFPSPFHRVVVSEVTPRRKSQRRAEEEWEAREQELDRLTRQNPNYSVGGQKLLERDSAGKVYRQQLAAAAAKAKGETS